MIELNKCYFDDCLEGMKQIDDKSIDMILCDLPYNITNSSKISKKTNTWDQLIDMSVLWPLYERIIKDNGIIALHAMQPFSSYLVSSCLSWCDDIKYRYEWIWRKPLGTGFLNAKKQPLRNHESILIFYKTPGKYYPQMRTGKPYKIKRSSDTSNYGEVKEVNWVSESDGERYPVTVLDFNYDKNKVHPTQKPLDLSKYLIKTYTDENDIVLDNTCGSGTTLLAAKQLNRKYIGFENNKEYFDISEKRLSND